MAAIPGFLGIPGINVTFWSTIGALRFLQEKILHHEKQTRSEKNLTRWMKKNVVAVAIAARNEEHALPRTLRSLKNQVRPRNIFVASDGSRDNTAKVARRFRVNVTELYPNRGKAGALVSLIEKFKLLDKYLFILFVDADTHINRNYLVEAIPFFADPDVVAVAGHGKTAWRKHPYPCWKMFFASYRDRLYNFLQYTIRWGQISKWLNVSPIIPGFASIYRTSALKKIDIATPGLVIEDFNMTFQIHHKKLGKIAYHPKAYGIARDPTNFRDYANQVKRWNLGFWQTVIKHGIWPSIFSLTLVTFVSESLLTAFVFSLFPFIFVILLVKYFGQFFPEQVTQLALSVGSYVTLLEIFAVFFIADYLITFIVAVFTRRPQHLFYGLGFPFLRFVDAILILWSLPLAFITKSKGSWVSPKR